MKRAIAFLFMILSVMPILVATKTPAKPHVIMMTASVAIKNEEGKIEGAWHPKTIYVKEGERVVLLLKSLDVPHNLYIQGYNLESAEMKPGKIVKLSFIADKIGTFPFYCHIACGNHHDEMEGRLIVVPKK